MSKNISPQSPTLYTNTNASPTENVLPFLKQPYEFYSLVFFFFMFVILLFILLFKAPHKTEATVTAYILYILLPLTTGFILFIILPNFKHIKQFLYQIRSASYVILYIIGLIIFFSLTPKSFLNDYAYIITPLTVFLASISLFKGVKNDFVTEFNVNYERIKSVILFVCIISLFIIFYSVDPGGYISMNFGYSLLLTTVLAIISFLYLIVLMTYNDNTKQTTESSTNLFSKFTRFSTIGSISFILFLILFTIGVTMYPGGLKNDIGTLFGVISLFIPIVTIWSILLVIYIFPETTNRTLTITTISFIQRAMLMLLGLTASGLLITFIVYNIQSFSGASSIPSLILNLLTVIMVLALVYKTVYVQFPTNKSNSKKNSFFSLLVNILFYIPCLFIGLFDFILNLFSGKIGTGAPNDYTGTSLAIIVTITLISLLYKAIPYLYEKINLQGGKLLLNDPIYLNNSTPLASHQELTGNDNFNYQYGLSCWAYIDSAPPNSNSSYSKYTSIMNYGGKPNILYKANTHTLLVCVINTEPVAADKNDGNTTNDENNELIDGLSYRIIYKNENVLLQKWNNIIINYNGGTLDVFLNGELVKSSVEVVPYMTLDTLTVGEKDGIHGAICNVVYFNKPLTRTNMFYLYNMVKNLTPPITKDKMSTLSKA